MFQNQLRARASAATALTAPGSVTVLTSDPEDLMTLCGGHVTVMKA